MKTQVDFKRKFQWIIRNNVFDYIDLMYLTLWVGISQIVITK